MKICHIVNYLPNYHRRSGGAEWACFNLIFFLHKAGIKNSVISLKPNKVPQEEIFDFYTTPISEDVLGYKLSFLKRLFFFDIVSFFGIRKLLKKIKPNVVHLHNFDLISLSAIWAAKTLEIPLVFSVYDYWIFSSDKSLGCPNKGLRKRIFNFFIKKINIFIVLSEHSKKVLIENDIPEQKISIVPLVIAPKNILEPGIIEENSILFAGWIQLRKGLLVLIRAFPEILKKIPQAKLYISGFKENFDYRREIDKFVKKHNLGGNIEWNNDTGGNKGKARYASFFKKAKIIVVPEQWQNMSPVIVAEGMFAGKTIVASRIGGLPDIIEDGVSGVLAEYDRPDDFAEKIIKLLLDLNYSDKISQNAKKRYQELFDPQVNIKKISAIYEKFSLEK